MTDDTDDLEFEYMPFDDANDRLSEAANALGKGDLHEAVNKMGEALASAISEATETIDELKSRIDDLESDLASRS